MKRIKEMKSSFDVTDAPSCEEIELEMVQFPPDKFVGRARANYDYLGRSEFELSFRMNDEIYLLSKTAKKAYRWDDRLGK